jgi:hypothetical protein
MKKINRKCCYQGKIDNLPNKNEKFGNEKIMENNLI